MRLRRLAAFLGLAAGLLGAGCEKCFHRPPCAAAPAPTCGCPGPGAPPPVVTAPPPGPPPTAPFGP